MNKLQNYLPVVKLFKNLSLRDKQGFLSLILLLVLAVVHDFPFRFLSDQESFFSRKSTLIVGVWKKEDQFCTNYIHMKRDVEQFCSSSRVDAITVYFMNQNSKKDHREKQAKKWGELLYKKPIQEPVLPGLNRH